MTVKKKAVLMGAALVLMSVRASGPMSEPAFVHLTPETSSFWHTATNRTLTVPIDLPEGAAKARLSVTGRTYAWESEDITDSSYTLTLPAATAPADEDVYQLALAFYDADGNSVGDVRTARLGLVQGLTGDGVGSTRCLFSDTARSWPKVRGTCVMPVPLGATLAVDGQAVTADDPGFTGVQGWYALRKLALGEVATVALTLDDETTSVDLLGADGGFQILIR